MNTKKNKGSFSKTNQPKEKWTLEKSMELGNELIEWLREKDTDGNDKGNMFFKEFLVIVKGLDSKTTNRLANKFKPFKTLMEIAKDIQEVKLVKYGVNGNTNAQMTKFVLMNNHGFSEKVDNTNTKGKQKKFKKKTITVTHRKKEN